METEIKVGDEVIIISDDIAVSKYKEVYTISKIREIHCYPFFLSGVMNNCARNELVLATETIKLLWK